MKTAWFMHMHAGVNTSVGVYPTPVGAFMRSWKEGRVEVVWYPMGHDFPGGEARAPIQILSSESSNEDDVDQAVEDFMQTHPTLCMTSFAGDRAPGIADWQDTSAGPAIQIFAVEGGAYLRIHAHGFVTVEHQALGDKPSGARSATNGRATVCSLSDACGDQLALQRADHRVQRHMRENAKGAA